MSRAQTYQFAALPEDHFESSEWFLDLQMATALSPSPTESIMICLACRHVYIADASGVCTGTPTEFCGACGVAQAWFDGSDGHHLTTECAYLHRSSSAISNAQVWVRAERILRAFFRLRATPAPTNWSEDMIKAHDGIDLNGLAPEETDEIWACHLFRTHEEREEKIKIVAQTHRLAWWVWFTFKAYTLNWQWQGAHYEHLGLPLARQYVIQTVGLQAPAGGYSAGCLSSWFGQQKRCCESKGTSVWDEAWCIARFGERFGQEFIRVCPLAKRSNAAGFKPHMFTDDGLPWTAAEPPVRYTIDILTACRWLDTNVGWGSVSGIVGGKSRRANGWFKQYFDRLSAQGDRSSWINEFTWLLTPIQPAATRWANQGTRPEQTRVVDELVAVQAALSQTRTTAEAYSIIGALLNMVNTRAQAKMVIGVVSRVPIVPVLNKLTVCAQLGLNASRFTVTTAPRNQVFGRPFTVPGGWRHMPREALPVSMYHPDFIAPEAIPDDIY